MLTTSTPRGLRGAQPRAGEGPIFNASQKVFGARQDDPWGLLAGTGAQLGEADNPLPRAPGLGSDSAGYSSITEKLLPGHPSCLGVTFMATNEMEILEIFSSLPVPWRAGLGRRGLFLSQWSLSHCHLSQDALGELGPQESQERVGQQQDPEPPLVLVFSFVVPKGMSERARSEFL